MSNVNTVVNTETNRDDNVDTGDNVNVDIPKVEESHDIHQGDPNHHHDHEAHLEVGKKKEGDHKDAGQSQTNISPKFFS